MRLGKAICIAIVSVFVVMQLGLAHAKMINLGQSTEGPQVTNKVESSVQDEQARLDAIKKEPKKKGSPMHAWKALVALGKKAGDIITSAEFAVMREGWSARTRGYELQSLVAIGVLSRKDADGNNLPLGTYRVVVDATTDQIDQINNEAKKIVNKTGRNGEALGIDSYRLDAKYIGTKALGDIKDVVTNVTGVAVGTTEALAEASIDFVQADINEGRSLPASVFINEGTNVATPFTINGVNPLSKSDDPQALLAALIDIKSVEPSAKIEAGVADFNPTKVNTVLFKGDFVTQNPMAFAEEFNNLTENQIAVIISASGDENEAAIKKALEDASLLGEWGNRIIVMGVKPDSPAAIAFAGLFGDKDFLTDYQRAQDIINNKDLVKGLEGAV